MSAPQKAMILAAGLGTRMGELTKTLPKPLLEAGGRTLLDHALEHCQNTGIAEVVVNLHYQGPQIREHLRNRKSPMISFSDETQELLDTGGGILRALPLLGSDPFLVMNSDAIFAGQDPCAALRAVWDPDRMDALMLLVDREQTLAYSRPGDFFIGDDGLTPTRRGSSASAPYVYTGAQIVSPSAFDGFCEGAFSMNTVWDRLLASGRLAATVVQGPWVDVGTPDGLAAADAVLAKRIP